MKTKKEVLDLTAKLFPMAKADELLPTRPDDAPRVLIAPDSALQNLVKQGGTEDKSIRSGQIDGISQHKPFGRC